MNEFIKGFGIYWKTAQFGSLSFWAFPVCALLLIWLFTVVGLKVFTQRKKLKSIFMINRIWIISAVSVAAVIIGLICYWWSINYFSTHPVQLSLLFSLLVAMLVPIYRLVQLRNFFTEDGLKEITHQPRTGSELESTIVFIKKAYKKNKWFYLVPLAGFILLFFYLNKGTNLISLVYDNSESMQETSATDALTETFDNLEENNHITLTTLDGIREADAASIYKSSMAVIMSATKSNDLAAGTIVSYDNPQLAKGGLSQVLNKTAFSPICESVWKTYLYTKETKAGNEYKNKVLIVITDGVDKLVGNSVTSGKFFYNDEGFAEYFLPDRTFIIDYSNGKSNALMQRFQVSGCEIFSVGNSKAEYLSALNFALDKFKNSWMLIYWTLTVVVILSIIGILISPKKII